MLVGPKGAGKSTLALALAARGHALLGDEHACYLPATGELLPFRRPVGIKPGPRSSAVEGALARRGRSPERDGMMRLPLEDLLDAPPAAGGRAARGRLPGRVRGRPAAARSGALARGRWAASSRWAPRWSNAPRTRRVFEMARLLVAQPRLRARGRAARRDGGRRWRRPCGRHEPHRGRSARGASAPSASWRCASWRRRRPGPPPRPRWRRR